MKTDPTGVLTGAHYLDGDYACGEGAMAAGCRFVAGYPITPSTEVVERISRRFPMMGGTFIQMEDELATMAAVVGAAWTGTKSMTVTSGPGFSLMMENIGLAAMMETPCVVVNVQRGGPSTGLPTMVGQADMMQARWGSHGDYELIALCPQSPQEAFDLTIDAFNLSETYRVPVMFMMDECVGHMTEKVVIPPADEIEIVPARSPTSRPGSTCPTRSTASAVPEFARAGDGYRFHTTGLTHDERGYPDMIGRVPGDQRPAPHRQDPLNADEIIRYRGGGDRRRRRGGGGLRHHRPGGPDGDRPRPQAGRQGRLPAADRGLALPGEADPRARRPQVKAFVVPEINYWARWCSRSSAAPPGKATAVLVPHAGGGVHDPEAICNAIVEAAR